MTRWISLCLVTILTLIQPVAAGATLAPDQIQSHRKKWDAHIEAEQGLNPTNGFIRLHINYHIHSASYRETDGPLFVWIRFNGHEGFFPMEYVAGRDGGRFEITLANQPYDCRWNFTGAWRCTEPSAEMLALLESAWDAESGTLRAWDMDLAFSARGGQWDSRQGSNYHIHFDKP